MAKTAEKKEPAKNAPVKKMRASTEPQSDSDSEESNVVENAAKETAQAETPKSKPKPKAKKTTPANGVKKAKDTTPKAKAAKATPGKAKAKPKSKKKGPSFAEMTAHALSMLKDRKGNTMAAIRNFIESNYQRKVNNANVLHIKQYMENEFLADRLRMTNSEGRTIDFSKRFALMK